MDYYVGLDVSLRSVAVWVIDVDGKRVFERTAECEIDDIVRCLEELPASRLRVGLNFPERAASPNFYMHAV